MQEELERAGVVVATAHGLDAALSILEGRVSFALLGSALRLRGLASRVCALDNTL